MSTRQTRPRTVGWWVIVIVGVVLAVNLAKSVVDFLKLKGRLTEAQTELARLKAEQDKLDKEYSYKTTPDYLEKEVRERLNMAKPGEKVVIIPEAELLEATAGAEKKVEDIAEEKELPVWRKWWNIFAE